MGIDNVAVAQVRKLSHRRRWVPRVIELPSILSTALNSFSTPTISSLSNRMKGMESYSDTFKFTIENMTFYTLTKIVK